MTENILERIPEEEIIAEKGQSKFFTILAKITYIAFFGFIFIGNSIPFSERAKSTEEIITSNIANQVAFPLLFLTAVITLIPKRKQVFRILFNEKMFAIFFAWGLATLLWSSFPFISFKRWFQVVVPIFITISAGLYIKDQKELFRLLKYILIPYLIISILSIALVPGARDENGAWRGLASSKNNLGQEAVMNLIIGAIIFHVSDYKGKIVAMFMLLLAFVLLVGSQSATSFSAFMFITFLGVLTLGDKYLRPLKMGRVFTVLGLVTLAAIALSILFLAPEVFNELAGGAGKDLTFTGRTNLWRDILHEANKHLLYGAGFQGYWVVENTKLQALYRLYIWLPNQAHNGYLDILNETGLIGLILFFLVVIKYAISLKKLKQVNYTSWFIIAILIINLQESTIVRPAHLLGVLFIFSYYTLFTGIQKQKMEKEELESGEYHKRLLRRRNMTRVENI